MRSAAAALGSVVGRGGFWSCDHVTQDVIRHVIVDVIRDVMKAVWVKTVNRAGAGLMTRCGGAGHGHSDVVDDFESRQEITKRSP